MHFKWKVLDRIWNSINYVKGSSNSIENSHDPVLYFLPKQEEREIWNQDRCAHVSFIHFQFLFYSYNKTLLKFFRRREMIRIYFETPSFQTRHFAIRHLVWVQWTNNINKEGGRYFIGQIYLMWIGFDISHGIVEKYKSDVDHIFYFFHHVFFHDSQPQGSFDPFPKDKF